MPECDYCGASYDDEDTYVAHLDDEHGDELSRVDQRRVEQHRTHSSGRDIATGPVVLVGVFLVAGVFVTYLIISGGGGQQTGPTHIHGTITMRIDGERVSVAQQTGSPVFHFHGSQRQWHVEVQGVTLKQALKTVGVEISKTHVRYGGKMYRETTQNTSITYRVNGQSVVPSEYVLEDGDKIWIIINTTGS